jgi:hypothetical protein
LAERLVLFGTDFAKTLAHYDDSRGCREVFMMAKIMKYVSIVGLLLSFFWSFFERDRVWTVQVGGYLELLVLAVWATAIMVVAQTIIAHKYYWAAGFVAVAVLFNPISPLTISRPTFLILDSVCILAFVLSLAVLRGERKHAVA